MRDRFHLVFEWLGRAGLAFLAFVLLYLALGVFAPTGALRIAALIGMLATGVWLGVRVLRRGAGLVIWRLRNRLLVTYLFIAALPILLVAGLAVVGGYSLVSQLAVYMVTSQLDRRIETLTSFTESVVRTEPASRPPVMQHSLDLFYRDRFPGIEILLREAGRQIRYPETRQTPPFRRRSTAGSPPAACWYATASSYLWSYDKTAGRRRDCDGAADPGVPGEPGSEPGSGRYRRREALGSAKRGRARPATLRFPARPCRPRNGASIPI